MAEEVGVNTEGDSGAVAGLGAESAEGVARHRLARVLFGGEEPVGGLAPAIVNAEPFPQGRRKWDIAGDSAFAVADVKEHAGRVDVLDLELAQFVAAQGGGVEGGEDGPVFQIVGVVEHAGDLLGGHDGDGERPFLGGGDLLVEPAAFEHPDVEEAQRGAVHLERIEGSFLNVAQVEKILPDIFGTEQCGGFVEVPGESPDGLDVAMDGGGGVVAQLQLLDHSFADGCHTANSFRSLVYPSA